MMFRPAEEGSSLSERLRAFSFAGSLSEGHRKALEEGALSCAARREDLLLGEGQACDPLVLVEAGSIRVFRQAPGGRQITLYRIEPGEFCVLAVSAALAGRPYPATAVALEEVRGLALDAGAFRRVFSAAPALQHSVLGLLARRLASTMTLASELAFERMDQRLASYLLRRARIAENAYAPIRQTHEEIAAELGTAREVVSRLLKNLEQEGLIATGRGQIRLLEPAALVARGT